jgi:hypothetical protein
MAWAGPGRDGPWYRKAHLLGDEEGRRLRDGRLVLAAGRQQRQQRPRGLHHSAAVVAQLLQKQKQKQKQI